MLKVGFGKWCNPDFGRHVVIFPRRWKKRKEKKRRRKKKEEKEGKKKESKYSSARYDNGHQVRWRKIKHKD
jgi:hypothetical protein